MYPKLIVNVSIDLTGTSKHLRFQQIDITDQFQISSQVTRTPKQCSLCGWTGENYALTTKHGWNRKCGYLPPWMETSKDALTTS